MPARNSFNLVYRSLRRTYAFDEARAVSREQFGRSHPHAQCLELRAYSTSHAGPAWLRQDVTQFPHLLSRNIAGHDRR